MVLSVFLPKYVAEVFEPVVFVNYGKFSYFGIVEPFYHITCSKQLLFINM